LPDDACLLLVMCGIIGYTGTKDAISVVLEGLKRLEYRGYDSAGIAFFSEGAISIKRKQGKVKDLVSLFDAHRPASHTAIGHTRWATHGRPSEENAHPHRSNGIVIVHNGIIENYVDLKRTLVAEGYTFTSDTDTEVLCHLIRKFAVEYPLEEAVRHALKGVKGAYAIAAMNEKEEGKIVGVRKDSPLCVGLGYGEYFLASDVPAFFSHSKDVIYLDDGEMVVMTDDGVAITNLEGAPSQKEVISIPWSPSMAEKGGYKHFMLKEIYEVPSSLYRENLASFADTLGLDELLPIPVRQLSLGQRMRCDLAAALLHSPRIVYLDEPTIGLDVVAKEHIREFIKTINRERGTTVLLTTHDLRDIEELCRRIMIIDHGRIIYDGGLAEIKARYGKYRVLVCDVKEPLVPQEALSQPFGPDGAEIVRQEEHRLWIRFPAEGVSAAAVTALVMERYAVLDLTIEEPSIESVIKEIYNRRMA